MHLIIRILYAQEYTRYKTLFHSYIQLRDKLKFAFPESVSSTINGNGSDRIAAWILVNTWILSSFPRITISLNSP